MTSPLTAGEARNSQYCEKKAEHDSHIQLPGFEQGSQSSRYSGERAPFFSDSYLDSLSPFGLAVKHLGTSLPADVALSAGEKASDRVSREVMDPAFGFDCQGVRERGRLFKHRWSALSRCRMTASIHLCSEALADEKLSRG